MSEESATPPMQTGGRRAPVLVIIGVALFIALLTYGLFTTGPSTRIDSKLADGQAALAPSFELAVLDPGTLPPVLRRSIAPALADGELALAELEGTPAIINFWASWCVPCRQEAPELQRAWERFGSEGTLFLGINMQDIRSEARGFIAEFGLTFPMIRDPSNAVARSYGATGIPETYFISANGRVVGHVIGVITAEQLRAGVRAARAGRVAGTRSGGDIRPQR